MSTKESKSDRVTRLFERKVLLDELDLDDLKFVSLHIQQAYIHTNLKGAKKAKGESKPNAFFQFRSALTDKVKELDLPSAPTWLSQFAGYLYTNKNWKEDTDKLEDEDELTRLHERFAAKNPIPEKKAKAAKAAKATADSEDEEAPKTKSKAKKVPVDSEDEEEEPAPKPKPLARSTSEPKPAAKATPKKEVKAEEEEEEAPKPLARSTSEPKPAAKATPKKEVKAEEEDEEAPKPLARSTSEPKPKAKVTPKVRMTPIGGGEVQTINGKEYYTAQEDGKLKVWTVKDGNGDDFVGSYNFKTKEIDTEEDDDE